MNSTNYLHRAPLLDSGQHVLGYKLAWQNPQEIRQPSNGANLRQLLQGLAEHPAKADSSRFFLDTGSALLPAELLQGLSPQNTVLILNQADLVNAGNLPLVMSLNALGVGLALSDVDLALIDSNDGLLSLMTHVELASDHPNLTEIANFARRAEPPLAIMVKKVLDWQEFDACAERGQNAFFGNLCLKPHKLSQSTTLGPQTVVILQLMQMVRDNADIRDLERVLQRDATLSY
ncbi:MAG: hypothetical protein ABIQ90_03490, partial [Polaromonas sp.]